MQTVGEKIRQLRVQAGLSQQQLAGDGLTRAFICMVEKGKARPSMASLERIAERLGQPVAALLDVVATSDDRDRVMRLMEEGGRAMAADPNGAVSLLRQACRLAEEKNLTAQRFAAYAQLGGALRVQRAFDEALDWFDRCLELAKAEELPDQIVKAYLHLADTVYAMHQFLVARRYYDRAVRETERRKSLMPLRQKALIQKGNCLIRLGEWAQGAAAYEEAAALHPYLGEERELAYAQMGLGVAYRRLGRLTEAQAVTLRSLELLQRLGDRNRVLVLHNLATIEGDLGLWQVALPKFETCREAYRVFGWAASEASLLEELALYARLAGDSAEAETLCQEALGRLEQQDDPILRGRLLGLLGELRVAWGDLASGRELLSAAESILRYFGDRDLVESVRHRLR